MLYFFDDQVNFAFVNFLKFFFSLGLNVIEPFFEVQLFGKSDFDIIFVPHNSKNHIISFIKNDRYIEIGIWYGGRVEKMAEQIILLGANEVAYIL